MNGIYKYKKSKRLSMSNIVKFAFLLCLTALEYNYCKSQWFVTFTGSMKRFFSQKVTKNSLHSSNFVDFRCTPLPNCSRKCATIYERIPKWHITLFYDDGFPNIQIGKGKGFRKNDNMQEVNCCFFHEIHLNICIHI